MNESYEPSIEEIRKSIVYLRAKNKILLECLKKYDKWRDDVIQSTNFFFDVSVIDENDEDEGKNENEKGNNS